VRVWAPELGKVKSFSTGTDDSQTARAFTDDEVTRILDAAQGSEHYGASLIGLYTGLRFVDIAHLLWTDIQGDFLCIRPRKTKRHGIRVVIPLHTRSRRSSRGRSGIRAATCSRRCTRSRASPSTAASSRPFSGRRRPTGAPAT